MTTKLEKMSIANLEAGVEHDDEFGNYFDYTHLLPEETRNEGYSLRLYPGDVEYGDGGKEVHNFRVAARHTHGELTDGAGVLDAWVRPGLHMRVDNVRVDDRHREKGVGAAMYEAAMKHAKEQHGATHISGSVHSSMARRIHQKLAEKHGMRYEAPPNYGPEGDWETRREWLDTPPGDFDAKYRGYKYTLKHIEDFMGEPMKKTEKLEIPARYMPPVERNLAYGAGLDHYEDVALEQMGYTQDLHKNLNGVRSLLGHAADSPIRFDDAVRLMAGEEEDTEGAALRVFGLSPTDDNRNALRLHLRDASLAKQEGPLPGVEHFAIQPYRMEAIDAAAAVQRGIDNGYLSPVKLNGKHSKGTMVVKDPQTKKVYLLKPGSGKNSPAKGVSEDFSSQSEREAAFWHVADYIGIGDSFPRSDLILVNGHQTAAMELLPITYKNLGQRKKVDPGLPPRILEPYRNNGTLFKWSLIDFILGNPDRHSQNMMVDPENRRLVLIDHGSAMAGMSFDPAHDENSFIPYYLRAWTGQKFINMTPAERVHFMPGLDPHASAVFDEWVAHIDEHHVAEILKDYNVSPLAAMERLAQIRTMPGPKWMVLNRLWAGSI